MADIRDSPEFVLLWGADAEPGRTVGVLGASSGMGDAVAAARLEEIEPGYGLAPPGRATLLFLSPERYEPASHKSAGRKKRNSLMGNCLGVEDLKTHQTGLDSYRLVTEVSPSLFLFPLAAIGS